MDSGNVMRATKVDTKKPFERENMSLLTYSTNGSPSWAEQALWTELEESFKMHLRSFLQMQPKGIKKIFFFLYLKDQIQLTGVLVSSELSDGIISEK